MNCCQLTFNVNVSKVPAISTSCQRQFQLQKVNYETYQISQIFEKDDQLDADLVFGDEHCTSDIDIELDSLEDDYMAMNVPPSCLNIVKRQVQQVTRTSETTK